MPSLTKKQETTLWKIISELDIAGIEEVRSMYNEQLEYIAEQAGNVFSIGEYVRFFSKRNDRHYYGTIIKINPKSIIIDCTEDGDGEWKVSPTMVEHSGNIGKKRRKKR